MKSGRWVHILPSVSGYERGGRSKRWDVYMYQTTVECHISLVHPIVVNSVVSETSRRKSEVSNSQCHCVSLSLSSTVLTKADITVAGLGEEKGIQRLGRNIARKEQLERARDLERPILKCI